MPLPGCLNINRERSFCCLDVLTMIIIINNVNIDENPLVLFQDDRQTTIEMRYAT